MAIFLALYSNETMPQCISLVEQVIDCAKQCGNIFGAQKVLLLGNSLTAWPKFFNIKTRVCGLSNFPPLTMAEHDGSSNFP